MLSSQNSTWRSPQLLQPGAIAPHNLGLTTLLSLLIIGLGEGAIAEPIPDRGPGDLGTQVIPQNIGFLIEDGTRRGGNLFHSFESFDIAPSDGAVRFNPANGVDNIIGRVAGGDGSDINGLLGVNGEANLFLIDPRGIVFGENAQLDLRGSFIASTADEIRFGDRGSFSAVDKGTPAANLRITPDALVFNQLANRPPINERTIRVERPDLEVTPGLVVDNRQSLILVGGSIQVQGGILQASEGRVEIAALGGDETVELPIQLNDSNRFQINRNEFSGETFSDVTLAGKALIDVTGANQGDITIYGRNITLRNLSSICAGIGSASVCANDRIDGLEADLFAAVGNSDSRAGNIVLFSSGNVSISQGSQVANVIYPNSEAQAVENSRDSVSDLLAVFSSQGIVDLDQLFGAIVVVANNIDIDGNEEQGRTAEINTSTLGTGNAGLIFLVASNSVDIKGDGTADNGIVSQLLSSVGVGANGNAGGVLLITKTLELSESAGITAATFGNGIPGIIDISADNPTTNTPNDGSVLLSQGSVIFSTVESGANGGVAGEISFASNNVEQIVSEIQTAEVGGITIRSGSVHLSDGSQLGTIVRGGDTLNAVGRGDAGNILIRANNLTIDEVNGIMPSVIFSFVGQNAIGDGGNVFLLSEDVFLNNGVLIATQTEGRLGLELSDNGLVTETSFSSGGEVFIVAENLSLNQGSSINVSASGSDNQAGSVFAFADSLQVLRNGSSIEARSTSGNGGNIEISGDFLFLVDGSNIFSESGLAQTGGGGSGGNISLRLDAIFALPFDADNNINAQAFDGDGGNVVISNNLVEIGQNKDDFAGKNDITASSSVEQFNSFDVTPLRGGIELPEVVPEVERLFVQVCPGEGPQSAEVLGALYVTGRGGIPPGVSDTPSTNDIIAEWITLPEDLSDATVSTAPQTIPETPASQSVEAQDLIQDANGELWLVADANATRVSPVYPNGCPS